jgi:hypothetical protein
MSDNTCCSSGATVTVRLIKSFEYKNFRNLIFHNLDLSALTLGDLERMSRERIETNPILSRIFPATSSAPLDTIKRYYTRHSAKSNNAIINVGEDDKLVLHDYVSKLNEIGFDHETEISWFNWGEYQKFCSDPTFKWE